MLKPKIVYSDIQSRFTNTKDEVEFYYSLQDSTVHIMTYTEHHYAHISNKDDLSLLHLALSQLWKEKQSLILVLEMLRYYADGPIMGDFKPTFSDCTWEEWISPVRVAEEYYRKQQQQKNKQAPKDSLRRYLDDSDLS
jgi:hypothetical protein